MKPSNWKLGMRLTLGFGGIVLLLLVLASLAASRLNANNEVLTQILNDRYVKVMLAQSMQFEVNVQARNLRNAIIAGDDKASVAELLDKVAQSARKNVAVGEKLNGMIDTPRERELFKTMMEARVRYRTAREVVVGMLQEGKAAAAGAYLLKELPPLQDEYFRTLAALVEFQQELMQRSGDNAISAGKSAILITVILASFACVAAVAIGIVTARSITHPLNRAVVLAKAVAAGDLSQKIDVTRNDEVGQLLQSLKDMNGNLLSIVGRVRAGTNEITTASTEIAKGNLDLSSRTEQQASALEETASSMEELTSTVKHNGASTHQANQLAQSAADVARRGGAIVADVVATMEAINTSSSKIVDIIGVIDGIAFQTNILALNAAVEAARAGEQGRGFAVVASEVRNLAQSSAAAAKEIKTLIGDSLDKVRTGNELVTNAGSTMLQVVASIERVTNIMSEIAAAGREQEAGIEQINQAVAEMDGFTQQNAALVEQAAAATAALEEQAAQLAKVVSVFKLDDSIALLEVSTSVTHNRLASIPQPARGSNASAAALRTVPAERDWQEF